MLMTMTDYFEHDLLTFDLPSIAALLLRSRSTRNFSGRWGESQHQIPQVWAQHDRLLRMRPELAAGGARLLLRSLHCRRGEGIGYLPSIRGAGDDVGEGGEEEARGAGGGRGGG